MKLATLLMLALLVTGCTGAGTKTSTTRGAWCVGACALIDVEVEAEGEIKKRGRQATPEAEGESEDQPKG